MMKQWTPEQEKVVLEYVNCKDIEASWECIRENPWLIDQDSARQIMFNGFTTLKEVRKQNTEEEKQSCFRVGRQLMHQALILQYILNIRDATQGRVNFVSVFFENMKNKEYRNNFNKELDASCARIMSKE
eukprot:GEZU01002216.1.p1 GENE.GEZU01002216.1~~GEZU01002216.1.p1  ORF type:complete len:148 (+),score=36.17 GEZU01002216.1:57-446(+)